MNSSECPVCKSRLLSPIDAPSTRTWTIHCPRCGLYLLTFEAHSMLEGERNHRGYRWTITSHAIRRMHSPDTAPHTVTQGWLQSVWTNEKSPNPQEQADTLIEFLGAAYVASGDLGPMQSPASGWPAWHC